MGWYENRVLPRLVDVVLGRPPFTQIRARLAAGLQGEVVEIGFGSGRNVPFYPTSLSRVRYAEPATGGPAIARGRISASPVTIERVASDAGHLPIESGSVDHVLCTFTLCSVLDPREVLLEVTRILRVGGSLHFVEHGRSPDARVAAWQRALTPVQRQVAGGCHLDRPIAELVKGSGLAFERLDQYHVKGPKPYTYLFEGVATKR